MKTPRWRVPSFFHQDNDQVGLILSIKAPGEWFDEPRFVCFVGGGGIGRAETLDDAIEVVQNAALAELRRRRSELVDHLAYLDSQIRGIETEGWGTYEEKAT